MFLLLRDHQRDEVVADVLAQARAPCAPACRPAAASARRSPGTSYHPGGVRSAVSDCEMRGKSRSRIAATRPRAMPVSVARKPVSRAPRRRWRRAAARAAAPRCAAPRGAGSCAPARSRRRACAAWNPTSAGLLRAAAAPCQQRIDEVDVLREREHARACPHARVGERRPAASSSACPEPSRGISPSAEHERDDDEPGERDPEPCARGAGRQQSLHAKVPFPRSTAAETTIRPQRRARTLHGRRPGCDERELLGARQALDARLLAACGAAIGHRLGERERDRQTAAV